MNGRSFIFVFIGFLMIFTLFLFYFQNFAFYERLTVKSRLAIEKKMVEVINYNGIDASSSGLKLRECFTVTEESFEIKDLTIYQNPTPLNAPFWFECFNAESITLDLNANKAVAFLSKKEEFDGIDKVIALYPDGTGFQWRQLNDKYTDK
ncbi:hypothetical protein CBE37_05360 [bacterium TMED277]|nr:MAG: hypothetical protein CBE37_05360 [bacterium TMED277]|tara:strand:+ start:1167 stop:1616 length:450 start_codon:yes stop_codon:yes gene_type:complete